VQRCAALNLARYRFCRATDQKTIIVQEDQKKACKASDQRPVKAAISFLPREELKKPEPFFIPFDHA
jgi:hypothetical protein